MQNEIVLSLRDVARLLGTSVVDVRLRARDFSDSKLSEVLDDEIAGEEWVN